MRTKKKSGKKRNIILIICGIVLAIVAFFATLRIENVTYEGNLRLTEDELSKNIFGEETKINPVMFIVKNILGEKVQIPFVEDYDIEMKSLTSVSVTVYEKSIVGYITYMGTYMYFDKDGIVVENSMSKYDDIPEITGISFENIILYTQIPVKNENVFDLILNVTQLIDQYGIEASRINISDTMEVKLYINSFRVNIGNDGKYNNKIAELADILPTIEDIPGELNMKEYSSNGAGYVFKKD